MYPNPRIPVGSWILVTGVNGLVASNIANLLLKMGYKVRGTVRNVEKSKWMQEKFDKLYGKNNFELVSGVSGVAHVASIVGSFDPNTGIPGVIDGAINTLKSAAKEPSVKAFVYTSTSWSAANPQPNVEYSIGPDSWNAHAIKAAWAPPPYGPERTMDVYAAGKAEAEAASWKFVKETKPDFVVNAVLPSANFGIVCDPEHQGFPSTTGWLKSLFDGELTLHNFVPPQYAIDTIDCARLHVGALLDAAVENQRLFGYAEPYTWNEMLAIFRKLYPDRKFMDDLPDAGRDLSIVTNESAAEVLRKFGKPGFTTFEESVRAATEQILAFEKPKE
ncbi:aldehyde reductase [Cadophora sp. DSE1049]|nr:aldehyde reductase [Cadophora sp. DSE1049]